MKKCCETYMSEQFGGDADVMNEIYGEYVKSVDEKIAQAESELGKQDWARLDTVAHTVKGNALAVGDEDMANTAIELRKASALKDQAAAAELIARLKSLRELL